MSIKIMTLVWELHLADSEKLVLLALADCANDEGYCWPGMTTLSRKCSKGERTVQYALRKLESDGHLSRREISGRGCEYMVHPRKHCTPAETAPVQALREPPQPLHPTPATVAPKPSKNRKKPSPINRAHQLPDDWKPSPFGFGTESAKVMDAWPPGELAVQLETFRAHHGKKGDKFLDWQKAWSTWVLNTRKFGIGRSYERADTNPTATALARVQTAIRSGGTFN
jgi:hypothetical protein